MKANITEDGLRLLAYLHEHARGYNKLFLISPGGIEKALGITGDQLRKDASYRSDQGLAGMETLDSNSMIRGKDFILNGVWLTSAGENYVRELESQPGVGKKVTVAVVKEMGNALRTIAVQILSNLFTKH